MEIKCDSKNHETSPVSSVRSPPARWGKHSVWKTACRAQPALEKVGPYHQILPLPGKVANQDHEILRWQVKITKYCPRHKKCCPFLYLTVSLLFLSVLDFSFTLPLFWHFHYGPFLHLATISLLCLFLCGSFPWLLFFQSPCIGNLSTELPEVVYIFLSFIVISFFGGWFVLIFCAQSTFACWMSSFSACVLECTGQFVANWGIGNTCSRRPRLRLRISITHQVFPAYSLAHVTCVWRNMFFSLYGSTSFRLQIRIVQGCPGQFPMVAESNEHSWYLHHNLSYRLWREWFDFSICSLDELKLPFRSANSQRCWKTKRKTRRIKRLRTWVWSPSRTLRWGTAWRHGGWELMDVMSIPHQACVIGAEASS